MIPISVNIDVPDLERGVRFYAEAFGLSKTSEPYPGVAVMGGAGVQFCLLEKPAGSQPAPGCDDARRYERHWTPVHVDFHVDDFEAALARAVGAGAAVEQRFDDPRHGPMAMCSDVFGHGFCLLGPRPRPPAP